jgi:hypothetical protein
MPVIPQITALQAQALVKQALKAVDALRELGLIKTAK